MSIPRPDSAETDSLNLSIVRNDLMFRAQRKVGLIPAHGLGVARRAIFWSLFAWLPIAAWAWYQGRISLPGPRALRGERVRGRHQRPESPSSVRAYQQDRLSPGMDVISRRFCGPPPRAAIPTF